jgi:hypothetical protein
MTTSGLCSRRNCVTRVGSSGETVELEIPQALDIGEFNLSSLESLSSGIVSSSGDNDPITIVTRDYGSEPFYSSVAAVNQFFIRPDVRNLINPEAHPLLTERVNSGIIFTPVEIAQFIRDFGYTPFTLSATSSIISIRLYTK